MTLTLTLHIHALQIPVGITLFGFLIVLLIGRRECKELGEFEFPLNTLLASLVWSTATIVSWGMFIFLK